MPLKEVNAPEIIERIYDVAVDPARLEELVDVWEARMAPLWRQGAVLEEENDTTFPHFSRMGLFLDRLQFSDPQNLVNEVSEAGALAAIVVSGDLKVQQVNDAAIALFNLHPGDLFSGISTDSDSQDALTHTIAKAIRAPAAPAEFLRFRLEGSERFVVIRVRGLENLEKIGDGEIEIKPISHTTKSGSIKDNNQKLALIVTTELAWHPNFGQAIANAFNLTPSEVEIVRALVEGHTIDSIAKSRGRAKATVRTQIRSIFEKTETRSQAELIRISLSLMDMVSFTHEKSQDTSHKIFDAPSLSPTVFHSLARPDGRQIDHLILGDPNGTPMLYFPGAYGLVRWPAPAEAEAKARGIKVIVPVRPGYGKSTPLPAREDYADAIAQDFVALMDHHTIEACPILTSSGDFCFATLFAARYPNRVTAIIASAPMMPLWKPEQFERMDKWYRFIVANARFAPKILPYLAKAGFFLALRIGERSFMNSIYSNSEADRKTFADPQVFEAIVTGATSMSLFKDSIAHKVFAREAIIQSSPDWINDLESLRGKVPIHIHLGESSPMVPPETLVDYQQRYDWVNFHIRPNAGELLFFKYWRETLDSIMPLLKKNRQ